MKFLLREKVLNGSVELRGIRYILNEEVLPLGYRCHYRLAPMTGGPVEHHTVAAAFTVDVGEDLKEVVWAHSFPLQYHRFYAEFPAHGNYCPHWLVVCHLTVKLHVGVFCRPSGLWNTCTAKLYGVAPNQALLFSLGEHNLGFRLLEVLFIFGVEDTSVLGLVKHNLFLSDSVATECCTQFMPCDCVIVFKLGRYDLSPLVQG